MPFDKKGTRLEKTRQKYACDSYTVQFALCAICTMGRQGCNHHIRCNSYQNSKAQYNDFWVGSHIVELAV